MQTIGAGAAMQALKMFTGGGEHAQGMGGHGSGMGAGSAGGGSSEGKFIGMAMAQASKLFDEQSGSGKVVSSAFPFLDPDGAGVVNESKVDLVVLGFKCRQTIRRQRSRQNGAENVHEESRQWGRVDGDGVKVHVGWICAFENEILVIRCPEASTFFLNPHHNNHRPLKNLRICPLAVYFV